MKILPALFLAMTALQLQAASPVWRVAHSGAEFNGTTEQPIVQAIAAAKKAGGGTIVIQAGTYQLQSGIRFDSVKGLTIRGEGKVVLQLRPAIITELSKAASVGEDSLELKDGITMLPNLRLRVKAPGEINSFTGKPTPEFRVLVESVTGSKVKLKAPLLYQAEAGTRVWNEDEPNLLEFKGACENIVIEHLTLEGGLLSDGIQQATHNTRCGVFIEGRFDYVKGPIGPKPQTITIRDCQIENFNGRGVAIYSADKCVVENCVTRNTLDEGIDVDHFANGCVIKGNQIYHAPVGIELNDANDSLVVDNHCEDVAAGIRIWRWCKQDELNVRNQIHKNVLKNIQRVALELQTGTANNSISDNVLHLLPEADQRKEKWFRDAGKDNHWENNHISMIRK